MAACPNQKIDSNVTGLRYAWEECLKQLPDSPVWNPLEPNSYSDFGGSITTVARNPINQSRQSRKGTVTDLESSGGFNQDLTNNNTADLLQGFFFASAREKATTVPMSGPSLNPIVEPTLVTGVTTATDKYAIAGADTLGFKVGQMVMASGFGIAGNNGIKVVATVTNTGITVGTNLTDEVSPPATAKVQAIGFSAAASDMSITMNGSLVRLNSAAEDFTTFGLIPGEWLYIGGDGAGNSFVNNVGFARVSLITADFLEFDKVTWAPIAEVAGTLTVRLFFGTVIRNESDPELIVRRSMQLERTLGQDSDGTMSEYLVGAVPNELTINVAQADKVNVDFGFVGLDVEQYSGLVGVKAGDRPALDPADAYNTSSDFVRIKLASVSAVNAAPTPLFAFATDLSLSINNGVTPNKAIGVLGAFDTSAGTFMVSGSVTAYFASIAAVQAVRQNADITIDMIAVQDNAGILFDIPLLSLGDGRLNIEQDQPVMVPLEMNAAESRFGHTLLFQSFPYLPDIAG
jgi:hypothetical protein